MNSRAADGHPVCPVQVFSPERFPFHSSMGEISDSIAFMEVS